MKKAIVVGAGIAGLATAIRLQAKGYQVKVFDKAARAGGKIGEIKSKGYRWDSGPSLFTLPHLIEELFTLCGEEVEDHFQYARKATVCEYFWDDGSQFSMPAKQEDFIANASQFFKEKPETLKRYLQNSKLKYLSTAPLFLDRSLHKLNTYLGPHTLKALSQLPKFDLLKSLDQVNRSYFSNPKLVQLFNRYATYNGSSPFKTPGIMSMIPSLEMQEGTYFPKKGMVSIAESLYQLALRQGVDFHFGEAIEELQIKHESVQQARSNAGNYSADVFVSNMDIYFTYKKLLPQVSAPAKTLAQEKSSSGLIFYWGIKASFPKLDLHNIFFSDNYKREFESIFTTKTLFDDPTIYVNITAKEKKDDAPEGCENWFVMINVPASDSLDWQKLIPIARENILAKLKRILGVSLSPLIETEEVLSPKQIEAKTSSHLGALYGSSSNSRTAAFIRHPNFSDKLNNLWFCGGSVHPGGGIPLCLKSAKISSGLIPDA